MTRNIMQPLRLSDWLAWHVGDCQRPANTRHHLPVPPGGTLPAMLRRRLDAVGRATCDALSILDPQTTCPLLHASRHGDAAHTLEMLEALTKGRPVSPTRFSMSVHNAVLGVHSIASQHHRPLQALSACGNEFEALLHEALGYLVEGHSAVVAVFSEGEIPAAYLGHTEYPDTPCVVGVKLSLDNGQLLQEQPTFSPQRPTPLDVIAWLNSDIPVLNGQHSCWQLVQNDA